MILVYLSGGQFFWDQFIYFFLKVFSPKLLCIIYMTWTHGPLCLLFLRFFQTVNLMSWSEGSTFSLKHTFYSFTVTAVFDVDWEYLAFFQKESLKYVKRLLSLTVHRQLCSKKNILKCHFQRWSRCCSKVQLLYKHAYIPINRIRAKSRNNLFINAVYFTAYAS